MKAAYLVAALLVGCSTEPAGTFGAPLRVERINDDAWRLLRPLCYRSVVHGLLIVPSGYVTDFASVPRWVPLAHALASGTAQPAATVHDWLYQTHRLPKRSADGIFYGAMTALDEPAWRREVMYAAVVVFGEWAWATGPNRHEALRNRHLVSFPEECVQ